MNSHAAPEPRPYTETLRMNDYVGSGIFAEVSWADRCVDRKGHSLGLLSHSCTRCGALPTIAYLKDQRWPVT